MRKSILLALAILLPILLIAQQEFCLKLEVVEGNASTVAVGVFAQGTGTAFKLGTSNLQFSFDGNSLENPRLAQSYLPEEVVTPFGTFTIYLTPTVTEPRPGEVSLNIELIQSGAGQVIDVEPGFFRIADIIFDRALNTADDPMAWIYDGGTTGTVLFLDDNATQIFASSFDCLTGVDASVLPTPLLYFNAVPVGKRSWVNWETVSEENNRGFSVEHSTDGDTFSAIGFVEGVGESAFYEFYHNQPVMGVNYYRYRQEDFDGTFVYSPVRAVVFDELSINLSVFPNPASNVIYLSGLEVEETSLVELRELNGRLIKSVQGVSEIGVSELSAGTYLLRVEQGEDVIYRRVIIAR